MLYGVSFVVAVDMMLIKYPHLLLLLLFSFSLTSYAEFFLDPSPRFDGLSEINSKDLCAVASNTHQYLNKQENDLFAVHQGSIDVEQVTLARVKKTLNFLCEIVREDEKNGGPNRLRDKKFLSDNFDFYRWYPDKKQANFLAENSTNKVKKRLLTNIPKEQIFLTKYYTKLLEASENRTEKYNHALYALPFDEVGLSEFEADKRRDVLTRYKYTRQEIIKGVLLDDELAQPLIWLTEEALHDVLLQGTGVVDVDGKRRYFNVHRNNGISYDYTIGKRDQARYWYFAEVPSIMGYGQTLATKIAIQPEVTFAGNVAELGLGKLFLISYQSKGSQNFQMGVLADQGGAFDNNLFQLDLLKGSYFGWKDYYQANKHLPDYVDAWLLVKKN